MNEYRLLRRVITGGVMRKFWKWTGLIGGGALALVILFAIYIFVASSSRLDRVYEVAAAAVVLPTDSLDIERGRHLVNTRGCQHCHGLDMGGDVVIDDAMVGQINGPNLTAGEGGIGATYTVEDWERAIRQGVTPDGRSLLIMPSHEYYHLTDDDLGAMVAYLQQLPAVDRSVPETRLGPLGRMLVVAGDLPISAELIDHAASRPEIVEEGETAEYGGYLAKTMCIGCHGGDLSGGPIPGGPPGAPEAANLTPHAEEGLAGWTEADFFRVLREGQRPDGSEIDTVMPRSFSELTDTEIAAIWKYLQSLPESPNES